MIPATCSQCFLTELVLLTFSMSVSPLHNRVRPMKATHAIALNLTDAWLVDSAIRNTLEAELLAMSTAGKETIWWNRFFDSIDFDPGHKTHIQCDNMQTIRAFTSDTPKFTTKMRHVDIHRHWIAIEWTSTKIVADGLTKPLSPQRHKEFIRQIGLRARMS